MIREITDPNILAKLVPGGNLAGINLENADLSLINLTRAHGEDVHLEMSNLEEADLRHSHFERAHFEGAVLIHAILKYGYFNDAHFEEAFLLGANFFGADFSGTHFERASLRGTSFVNTRNVRGAHFNDADLEEADFRNVNAEGSHFDGADLTNADFRGARLHNATFRGAVIYGTLFTREHLSQEQLQQIGVVQRPVQPILGMAYEIHNMFNAINIDGIGQYTTNFNNDNNHPINPNTIPNNQQGPINLFTPLVAFVENSDLFAPNEKEMMKNDLQVTILPRVTNYENFERIRNLLESIVGFVSRQDDIFIEQYIRAYKQDCLEAYSGASPFSCVKGMVERIITSLNDVSKQLLLEFPENQTYNEIKNLFPNIVFNDLVQEWSQKYLEDGESNAELIGLTPVQRMEHFIRFMRERYGSLLTQGIVEQINRAAQNYETAGVFNRMAFGITKRTKRRIVKGKKVKRVNSSKKVKNNKKSIRKMQTKKRNNWK